MNNTVLIVADPTLPVPPETYGGIERIVNFLAEGLSKRGWEVTLACHPDSKCPVALLPMALRKSARWSRTTNALLVARQVCKKHYSIVHSFGHIDLIAPLWPFRQAKIQSFQSLPLERVIKKRLRLIPRRNLWFTVCGHHMANSLSAIAPTRTIHNGVKLDQFTFQDKIREDAPLVFLGRIEPIKGTHHAIQIAKASGRHLIIAGNISDTAESRDYFSRMVEPELSDQVTYVGPINDTRKNALLGGAAALLMPIEWDEPFGIVMAEALACGTPVIGTARGALPEIVNDGVTGACCHTIEEMIKAARSVGSYSRSACRKAAESKFSAGVIVSQYEAMYKDVLGGKSLE